VQRNHTFFTKTLMRIETCQVCNKKIRFGRNCLKCRDCRSLCHPECKAKVPLPCIPSVPTPKKIQDAGLASFCPNSIPRVPAILVHCITEIERRGLTDVGIYRVPGSEKVKKELKERLLKVRGQAALDKVSDVNVICGVVKDFLTHLREPVLTFRLHNTFMAAIDAGSGEDVLAGLLEAIAELPPCNKDTLAYLILHIQKVASFSEANKMPLESLAKIFGPTLVGHASAKPDPSVQWKDAEKQPKVVQRLLNITPDYWRQYLSPMENPEPVMASPNLGSTRTSPAGFTSPSTPEQRPVPESPFLGSCQQSPRTHRAAANRGAVTPGFSQRRNGNFFPSLN
jgi:Rac GTPase-activating protein 1